MDRFTSAVVAGVFLLIVAALAAAAVAERAAPRQPDLTTPSGVVLAYAAAEQRGDPQTAWDLLAPAAQARVDRDRFLARAGVDRADNTYLSTEDERIDPDATGASVVLVRSYPSSSIFGRASGYSSRTTVRLVRSADVWRISVPPDDFLFRNTLP